MSLDIELVISACPTSGQGGSVYEDNITHNLAPMAAAAGLYYAMWMPEAIGVTVAKHLVEPLTTGLAKLESDPPMYTMHNPDNGHGDYDGLVAAVRKYLKACKEYPTATIETDR